VHGCLSPACRRRAVQPQPRHRHRPDFHVSPPASSRSSLLPLPRLPMPACPPPAV
jgi:hypothetical protein